jgi:hypothetical protein
MQSSERQSVSQLVSQHAMSHSWICGVQSYVTDNGHPMRRAGPGSHTDRNYKEIVPTPDRMVVRMSRSVNDNAPTTGTIYDSE